MTAVKPYAEDRSVGMKSQSSDEFYSYPPNYAG